MPMKTNARQYEMKNAPPPYSYHPAKRFRNQLQILPQQSKMLYEMTNVHDLSFVRFSLSSDWVMPILFDDMVMVIQC